LFSFLYIKSILFPSLSGAGLKGTDLRHQFYKKTDNQISKKKWQFHFSPMPLLVFLFSC